MDQDERGSIAGSATAAHVEMNQDPGTLVTSDQLGFVNVHPITKDGSSFRPLLYCS